MQTPIIYLDNAATSFPKPKCVLEKTCSALFSPLGNPGRSGHEPGRKSAEEIFRARENIARLLGLSASERVVFTGGATTSLNLAILGAVESIQKQKRTPFVVTSVFEHNSVLRPLFLLERKGQIRLRIVSPLENGFFSENDLFYPVPDILVLTLKSNVTGRTFPIKAISRALSPYGTLIIGDGAQAVGGAGATFDESGVHILCAPGHKGLFGIMGAGFMAFSENCPLLPAPMITGGSGTDSFNREMPENLPERLEAGTLPVPAIISMGSGAEYLNAVGVENVTRREKEVKRYLVKGIRRLSKFTLYEPYFETGPILINHKGKHSEETASALAEKGICVRGGFHCAPLAHRFLGTEETGGVRLSPGPFTTKEELDRTLEVLESI